MSLNTLVLILFISWLGVMISHAQKKEALVMAFGVIFAVFFAWLSILAVELGGL